MAGSISTGEMSRAVQEMGISITPAQLTTMMQEADPDQSGEIEYEGVRIHARPSSGHAPFPACARALKQPFETSSP